MQVKTFCYQKKSGWSEKFPTMDSASTVIFVFGAPEYLNFTKPFEELKAQYPQSTILGCSGAGEIFDKKVQDHSLSVAVVKFEKTSLRSVCIPIPSAEESNQIGKTLAKKLEGKDLAGIVVLSDGIVINGTKLVEGFNEALKGNVIVTGGLAGDGTDFKQTWILKDGMPMTKHISAIGFYGKHVNIAHGSQGGWDIFGPERAITRSAGNKLFEIDGKPALQLYKEYLGDKAKELPASGLLFPLQIRKNGSDERKLVRTILGVDEKENALVFAGDMPEGWYAQLMKANFSRLIQGAADAAQPTVDVEGPMLNIAISCVGRRLVLGQRTEEELEAVMDKMPKGTEQVGFYSYGELSPYIKGGACDLHNQTMTLTLISETV